MWCSWTNNFQKKKIWKNHTYSFHHTLIIYKTLDLNSYDTKINKIDKIYKFKLENRLNVLFLLQLKYNEFEHEIL